MRLTWISKMKPSPIMLVRIIKLILLLTVLISHTMIAQSVNVDAGKAMDDLRDTDPLVGFIYAVMAVEFGIIVYLFKKLESVVKLLHQQYEKTNNLLHERIMEDSKNK